MRVTRRRSLPVALLLSIASGLATSLAFPPAGLWPIAFVSLVPFLWALRGARPGRGSLLGFAFGFAFFGATLYWILLFGELAWLALTLGSAAAVAVVGLLASAVRKGGHPILSTLAFAALWVAVDWARGRVPFGGFTWGQLGVSQVANRATLHLASVTGVWGVTFAVVVVNGLVLLALEEGSGGALTRSGSAALAAAIILAPLLVPWPEANGRAIDVAAIQVDVRPFRGLPPQAEDRAVAAAILKQNASLEADPPQLVSWGESALDPGAVEPTFFGEVRRSVERVGAPTVAGSIQPGPEGGLTNSALVFDAAGNIVDRYDKVHLVPFGEYVPLRGELSWVSALRQIPYDLTPGTAVHTVAVPGASPDGPGTFGTPICFENSFPAIDRAMVRAGAGFLMVLTNNASYELTAASSQHLQMSQMRAVEDGRWVVHSAVSGISAFVDPTGRIVGERGLFDTGLLRHVIRSSTERTWYVRLGDWFPLASALFVGAWVVVPRRRTADRGTPGPLPERPRTLVILPTYEERETIGWVLERLLELPDEVDVLVVDDSSPDGTAQVATAIAAREPRVRIAVRPAKAGLASAYLHGFRLAIAEAYDLVVEMDSDRSHDPGELPGLLRAARDHDLTVGSRYVPGGSVTNWSRPRVALSRGGNLYARWMLGVPVADSTSGYRAYRRTLLEELIAEPIASDGYGFQIELVWRTWRLGYAVTEVPITFREREHGISKISRRIVFEALWSVTKWGIRARLDASDDRGARLP